MGVVMNVGRAAAIAAQLQGKPAETVDQLAAVIDAAASGDALTAGLLAEGAPGVNLVNDRAELAAAIAFFGLPGSLTIDACRAAIALLGGVAAAGG